MPNATGGRNVVMVTRSVTEMPKIRTVASPTDAYRGVIRQGENGWLADSQEWEKILRAVVSEGEEQRASIASRAREEARERYGWDRQTAIIEAALFDGW